MDRFLIAVDAVVFAYNRDKLKILLIKRGIEPFLSKWALPGGFLRKNESLEDAVKRELKEETNVNDIFLKQLHTFSSPERDPRERVVTTAYYALVSPESYTIKADTDASDVKWFYLNDLPELAFDHNEIIKTAISKLRKDIEFYPVGFELLPEFFTLVDLQKLYETIFNRKIDKRNFRKKLFKTGLIIETGKFDTENGKKPAKLYYFDKKKYDKLNTEGFKFKII